jgi:hypothetical protein
MQVHVTHIPLHDARLRTLLTQHRAFWQRDAESSFLRSVGVFAPSVPVSLPQPDGSAIRQAERLTPDKVDPTSMIAELEAQDTDRLDLARIAQRQSLASLGLGDQLPFSQPFFKIPWIEAMLGCPIKMTEGQIWVERHTGDLETLIRRGIHFDHNAWFQLYLEFLRQLEAKLGSQFPVTANTLLRGPSDLVAAIMGVREACIRWIEEPALMARVMELCTDANLAVIEAGNKILHRFQNGYISGWGIWTDAPVVRTQADHSSLLSPRMYETQILPHDLQVIRACPRCIFHIHNNGLHVAPILVQIPELDVIEVVVDPYPTGERKVYEVQMLQMIQQHKPLMLDLNLPSIEEAEWLLGQLDPRGLCFNARFAPEVVDALPDDTPGSEMWVLGEPLR